MTIHPHSCPTCAPEQVVCDCDGAAINGALPRHIEYFWRRVDRSGCCCWLWTGQVGNRGYGQFKYRLGPQDCRSAYVHRFAYELLVGPIPDGLHLDHLCRVRLCVNPAHLEPVTNLENTMRSLRSRGQEPGKCINGHEKTPDNTYVVPRTGSRVCRICKRVARRRADAKRRAS